MSDGYLTQEMEETLNKKAGISVLTIDNSEHVSTPTENYLPEMETTTLAPAITSIAPPPNNSRNTLPTTPHKVGTSTDCLENSDNRLFVGIIFYYPYGVTPPDFTHSTV